MAKAPKASTARTAAPRDVKGSQKSAEPSKGTAKMAGQGTVKTAGTTRVAEEVVDRTLMGLPLKTWASSLKRARASEGRGGRRGFLYAFGHRDLRSIRKIVGANLGKWQYDLLAESDSETSLFQGPNGPVWILRVAASVARNEAASAKLEKTSYAKFRDLAGALIPQLTPYRLDKLLVEMHALSLDDERAVVTGFEMAAYSFMENRREGGRPRKKLPSLLLMLASESLTDGEIQKAARVGLGVNIARHLVNLPGGDLDPATYATAIRNMFSDSDTVKVEIWEGERLREERMNLLLAVGNAAEAAPRLVRMRYRPRTQRGAKPIAIVGKGITFDSGGLDIKPSSGMRLMKKDMGGSAAAVAIMKWAEQTQLDLPLDIYVALAENAVGAGSFRPGDVIVSRAGLSVEIHNTDAEGRLVLADALDVAATREGDDAPAMIVNLATLTGAIKVGLGAEIAGLFSNDDRLARWLTEAGASRGDFVWRMPLFQPYRASFKSNFADVVNATDGFGGAITAALFLESFVRGIPWAHLDIYAWKDGASGAWAEGGGNGQPVQLLTEFLEHVASEAIA